MLLVLTVRSDDRPAEGDRFHAVRSELGLHSATDDLVLPPLQPDAIAAVVSPQLGTVSQSLAALVHTRSGGNPLHALALVDDWRARGLLREDAGGGDLLEALAGDTRVPSTLRDLIEQRLRHLDDTDVATLEAAAVGGLRVDVPTVTAAFGPQGADSDEVERRLTVLARRGLLTQADRTAGPGSAGFAFRDALFREALYDRIPAGGGRACTGSSASTSNVPPPGS